MLLHKVISYAALFLGLLCMVLDLREMRLNDHFIIDTIMNRLGLVFNFGQAQLPLKYCN